jgi:DNA-3-methyladenine glycosylase II
MSSILIPIPSNFSFSECLWFLDRNFDDCMHCVRNGEVRKAVVRNGKPVLINISATESHIVVEPLKGEVDKQALRAYIDEWFDLGTDLQPFYSLLQANSALAYMADEYAGLRLVGIPDLFEALCWSIIGQQINLTFAYKLKRRLVEKYGTGIEYDCVVYHMFPAPEVLAAVTIEDLRTMQFSGSKAQYLIDTAKAFADGAMSRQLLEKLPDFTSRQQALTSLRGIGLWTANYVLMKTLKDPNAIPYGDAGLLNALLKHGLIIEKKDTVGINKLFSQFKGWESYLVFYLWRSLAVK